MPVCPKCGEPVTPGPRQIVWGYQYDVDANGEWISGSERGAFFHGDCWEEVKRNLPSEMQDPPPPAGG